jgi:hypothetical protein
MIYFENTKPKTFLKRHLTWLGVVFVYAILSLFTLKAVAQKQV